MRKMVFCMIIVTAAVIACNKKNASTMEAQNKAFITKYFVHFNKHDWAGMAAMYANPAEFKDPSLGPGIIKQTHAQIIQKYTELAATFPDVHDEVTYPSVQLHLLRFNVPD
jgi:hypothetical protein